MGPEEPLKENNNKPPVRKDLTSKQYVALKAKRKAAKNSRRRNRK